MVLEAAGFGGERRQEQSGNYGGRHGFSGEQAAVAGGRDAVHQIGGASGGPGAAQARGGIGNDGAESGAGEDAGVRAGELIGASDVAGRYDRHIMATALDVKFQDHYAILQVDPQAVSETIQRAYSKLAQKYNSRNADTGDVRMFAALNLAYEVLSDPARRKEFDAELGISQEGSSPKFSGVGFFDALGPDAGLRTAILCLLYDRRAPRPARGGLSMRQVEIMVEATAVELSAALWYMKQRA